MSNGSQSLAIAKLPNQGGSQSLAIAESGRQSPTLKGRCTPCKIAGGQGLYAPPLSHHADLQGDPVSLQAISEQKEISFFWQGIPPRSTAQTRRHSRSGKTFRTPANLRAVATLRAVCEPHAPRIALDGPVAVEAALTFPHRSKRVLPRTRRPDADNLAKDLLDALQATGFFNDDSQVACLIMRKFDGPIPGIFVRVSNLP